MLLDYLLCKEKLAKGKFLRQIIRRWRYVVFSKKLALNKMKTIYKNLHMTYLKWQIVFLVMKIKMIQV